MTAEGGDSRPIRYVEFDATGAPTRVVYRASSLGGCERAMIATARGLPKQAHPDWFAEVLEEGNTAEPMISQMWDESTGVATVRQQEELELFVMDLDLVHNGETFEVPVVVRAHIDGRADSASKFNGTPELREYKKFRNSTWPNFIRQGCEINLFYPWQLAAMMHAIKATEGEYPLVEMVAGRWEDDTVQEVSVHYIDNPPIPLRGIKKKIARIERLLAEGYDATDPEVVCTENQYPCGFFRLHPSALAGGKVSTLQQHTIKSVPEEIAKALIHDTAIAGTMKGLRADLDKLDAKRKANRTVLTDWLAREGVKVGSEVEAGGYRVVWSMTAESEVAAHTRKGYEKFEVRPVEAAVKVRGKSKAAIAAVTTTEEMES